MRKKKQTCLFPLQVTKNASSLPNKLKVCNLYCIIRLIGIFLGLHFDASMRVRKFIGIILDFYSLFFVVKFKNHAQL